MHPTEVDELALDKQLDEICEGFRAAIEREVASLEQEGQPIFGAYGNRIIDLQQQRPR